MFNLIFLQTLNGIQLGVLLFLVAAGLTLIFGVIGLVNLAHGVLYMLGAYLFVTCAAATGSFLLGALIAVVGMFVLGIVLDALIFQRLYERSHLDQVLATFGLILIFSESVKMIWGSVSLSISLPDILSGSIPLFGNLRYPTYRLLIIVAGLVIAAGLYLLVNHTRLGMLLRAGATNHAMVSALGVNIRRLFMLIVGLGATLAGFAGAIVAPVISVEPGMGDTILILAFVVIVIGGVGSVRGAFVAAILIGLVDTLGRSFAPMMLSGLMEPSAASQAGRTLTPMLIYILMAMVLFFKPAGLFPAPGGSK